MISILNSLQRVALEKQLKAEIKSYNGVGVPDWLGMMKQGVQDGDSTVAVFDYDKALVAYRVRKDHIKIMSLGSRGDGNGTRLIRWLEQRFAHKVWIELWASPNAREYYEKLGYERQDWGIYRKMNNVADETNNSSRSEQWATRKLHVSSARILAASTN